MHGHLPGLQPADVGDQLLLVAMEWIGGGLFAIMAVAVLGSLMLSGKSRGTVTVDDLGVTRQIGEQSRTLRWQEIEGFVVTPIRGGITLIPREGNQMIAIPRFLDDYRGCVAEIKARGVGSLPASRLKRKRGWREALLTYAGILAFTFANDARDARGEVGGPAGLCRVFCLADGLRRFAVGRSWVGSVGECAAAAGDVGVAAVAHDAHVVSRRFTFKSIGRQLVFMASTDCK